MKMDDIVDLNSIPTNTDNKQGIHLPSPEIIPLFELPENTLDDEQTDLLRELVKQSNRIDPDKISYRYNKATHSLIITKVEEISINFTDKRGNSQTLNLFEVLEECLEEMGQANGKYMEASIPIKELIKKLSKRGIKNVNKDWIISARSNLLNSKIKIAGANEYILISEFNREINGYIYKRRITL